MPPKPSARGLRNLCPAAGPSSRSIFLSIAMSKVSATMSAPVPRTSSLHGYSLGLQGTCGRRLHLGLRSVFVANADDMGSRALHAGESHTQDSGAERCVGLVGIDLDRQAQGGVDRTAPDALELRLSRVR